MNGGARRQGGRRRLPREAPELARVVDLAQARRARALLAELAAAVQHTDPERTAAMLAGELDCPGLEHEPPATAGNGGTP